MIAKGPAFVEQHHVFPLRALRLVHGQRIAVVEIIVAAALLPWDIGVRRLEYRLQHLDLGGIALDAVILRPDQQVHERLHRPGGTGDRPQRPVEQALCGVVAQAHELVASLRKQAVKTL